MKYAGSCEFMVDHGKCDHGDLGADYVSRDK